MQRDVNSDDRTKAGASGRTPPIIEGEALEVAAPRDGEPGAAGPAEQAAEASAQESAPSQAPIEANDAEEAQVDVAQAEAYEADNAASADAIAAPPPRKKSRGALAVVFGALIVAGAGAVAWIAAPGHRAVGDGSLKSRVIALLPESAQRALHLAPATPPKPEEKSAATEKPPEPKPAAIAEKPAATEAAEAPKAPSEPAKPEAAKLEAAKLEAAKPEAAKTEPAKPEAPKIEPETTATPEPKPTSPVADKALVQGEAKDAAAPSQAAPATSPAAAPVAAGGPDPKQIEDMSAKIDGLEKKFDALQTKIDAAFGRIDAMQSKVELAQGKLEQTQSRTEAAATADAVAQAAQRLETVAQRLAAIEQKLEQPKTDARAPQARENATPSAREFAASRAVVAQATAEALRAGAPLADDLAALKGLGIADDKIADLMAYAKSGAPTVAQLTQQWRALRDKVVALEAPPPGASVTDKLLARAKGVFRITWSGQSAQTSIGATVARVDAALQKNDLAAAAAACDDFPAVAKNLVADWRNAASARLKADGAARALLSESISAIGRSSSQ